MRWNEHFAEVFDSSPGPLDLIKSIEFNGSCCNEGVLASPAHVLGALLRLRTNRGVGRDGIAAELLQAGGLPLATALAPIYQQIIDSEDWPVAWTGGKIVDVHKGKGPKNCCDEYRGILLENHLGKGLKEMLAEDVNPHYTKHMPDMQHGAVAGRGTDLASHIVASFLDYCRLGQKSCFVLYLDLVKAFDRVIREVVLGFPDNCDHPDGYLRELGLTDSQRKWMIDFVAEHGCSFE